MTAEGRAIARSRATRDIAALAGLFAVSGVLHFVVPERYERIVPRPLPAKRRLVQVSGAAELACAVALVTPRLRRLGGWASAVLLVAVYPANVQLSLDLARGPSRGAAALGLLRLPVQLPLVRTALKAARAG